MLDHPMPTVSHPKESQRSYVNTPTNTPTAHTNVMLILILMLC